MTTHTSGLTWLELFFLSVAMSDNPWALLHSASAHTQPTIARQLREFATASTITLKFMLSDADHKHFVGSTKQPNRLAAYGYQNRTAHTCTHIALNRATQSALHHVMLSFRQSLSPEQRESLNTDSLHIKTSKFAGYHVHKGGKAIIKLAESIRSDLANVQSSFAQAPGQPCSFFLSEGPCQILGLPV